MMDEDLLVAYSNHLELSTSDIEDYLKGFESGNINPNTLHRCQPVLAHHLQLDMTKSLKLWHLPPMIGAGGVHLERIYHVNMTVPERLKAYSQFTSASEAYLMSRELVSEAHKKLAEWSWLGNIPQSPEEESTGIMILTRPPSRVADRRIILDVRMDVKSGASLSFKKVVVSAMHTFRGHKEFISWVASSNSPGWQSSLRYTVEHYFPGNHTAPPSGVLTGSASDMTFKFAIKDAGTLVLMTGYYETSRLRSPTIGNSYRLDMYTGKMSVNDRVRELLLDPTYSHYLARFHPWDGTPADENAVVEWAEIGFRPPTQSILNGITTSIIYDGSNQSEDFLNSRAYELALLASSSVLGQWYLKNMFAVPIAQCIWSDERVDRQVWSGLLALSHFYRSKSNSMGSILALNPKVYTYARLPWIKKMDYDKLASGYCVTMKCNAVAVSLLAHPICEYCPQDSELKEWVLSLGIRDSEMQKGPVLARRLMALFEANPKEIDRRCSVATIQTYRHNGIFLRNLVLGDKVHITATFSATSSAMSAHVFPGSERRSVLLSPFLAESMIEYLTECLTEVTDLPLSELVSGSLPSGMPTMDEEAEYDDNALTA